MPQAGAADNRVVRQVLPATDTCLLETSCLLLFTPDNRRQVVEEEQIPSRTRLSRIVQHLRLVGGHLLQLDVMTTASSYTSMKPPMGI
ncbi:hypothetical protein J6590_035665 [Homalodisca vitripennis]|nr:hypothetical protein J6590_035663 [Homalodisca vitripennis]KAG8331706.1 hypothetical protein J6590_035665 [Homalodisca vitripennis]